MKKYNDDEVFQIGVFFICICIAFTVIFTYGIKFYDSSNDIDYNSISRVEDRYINDKDLRYSITSDGYLRIERKHTVTNMIYNPTLKYFIPDTFTYYKTIKLIKITSTDQN